MESHTHEVTLLLDRLADGGREAENRLYEIVMPELRRLAVERLKRLLVSPEHDFFHHGPDLDFREPARKRQVSLGCLRQGRALEDLTGRFDKRQRRGREL